MALVLLWKVGEIQMNCSANSFVQLMIYMFAWKAVKLEVISSYVCKNSVDGQFIDNFFIILSIISVVVNFEWKKIQFCRNVCNLFNVLDT